MARLRKWAAVAVAGALVGGGACAQPAEDRAGEAGRAERRRTAEPAKTPTARRDARRGPAAYAKTPRLHRHLHPAGALGGTLTAEQVGEMKVRVSPVGVYVRFARPEAIAGTGGGVLRRRRGAARCGTGRPASKGARGS